MQPQQPLLTIGVPVFNGARFLRQCLDSLLSQSFTDFTLVISDNASTDDTRDIAESYARTDRRVRYHRHPKNIGMYPNLNFVLRWAESKYVKLATADDCWSPSMVGDTIRQLESDPSIALCYPMMTMIDSDGNNTARYEYRLHLTESDPVTRFRRVLSEIRLVNQLNGVIRTDVVRRMLPLLAHTVGDRIFVAELSLYGKIFHLDEYQYFRRFHEKSSSYSRDSEAHQVAYVFAGGAKTLRYEAWKYHFALLRRVARSPLRPIEKTKLLATLLRGAVWDRHRLARDLLTAVRS